MLYYSLASFSIHKPSLFLLSICVVYLFPFSCEYFNHLVGTSIIAVRFSHLFFFFHSNQQWSKLIELVSFFFLLRPILAILYKDHFVACLCIFSFYFFLTITG